MRPETWGGNHGIHAEIRSLEMRKHRRHATVKDHRKGVGERGTRATLLASGNDACDVLRAQNGKQVGLDGAVDGREDHMPALSISPALRMLGRRGREESRVRQIRVGVQGQTDKGKQGMCIEGGRGEGR